MLSVTRTILTASVVAGLLTLAGCGGGGGATPSVAQGDYITTVEEAKAPGDWTILVYLDADNDLESAGISNLNQMEAAGSTRNVRIIVQIDRIDGYDASNGNWTDTRRYLVTRDNDRSVIRSVRLDDPQLGEVNMSDWRSLEDFVEWGAAEFPADHYALIIWDHGTGWSIRTSADGPEYRSVVTDTTSGDRMNVTDIPAALAGLGLDIIDFDACYMQQLEVACQLRNCARYLVGSAAAEPTPGYNYADWLPRIVASTTPDVLCAELVASYARTYPAPRRGITRSALDLSRVSDLARAAGEFADELGLAAAEHGDDLKAARDLALNYSTHTGETQRYSLDLIDYARRAAAAVGGSAASALESLETALSSAIVAESHNPDTPTACGIAVYLPPPTSFDSNYLMLDLAASTTWDEWLLAQPK